MVNEPEFQHKDALHSTVRKEQAFRHVSDSTALPYGPIPETHMILLQIIHIRCDTVYVTLHRKGLGQKQPDPRCCGVTVENTVVLFVQENNAARSMTRYRCPGNGASAKIKYGDVIQSKKSSCHPTGISVQFPRYYGIGKSQNQHGADRRFQTDMPPNA